MRARALVISVLSLLTISVSANAEGYAVGEACSTAGAYHTNNDATGVFHLVCNGAVWVLISKTDNTGSVGYGTLTPGSDLHVLGTTQTDILKLTTTSGLAAPDISPVSSFVDLDDAPSAYAGQGGKFVAVNVGQTALEFVAEPAGTPIGNDGEIQFNSGGSFGASSNLFWDQTNGRLGVNDNTPDAALQVVGDIYYTGVISDVSDRRLKTAITPLPSGQLDRLRALQAVSFRMKDSPHSRVELGLIAQDVEKVYPELVLTQSGGTKSLNYIGLIGPLIAALQEQQAQIEALESELQSLKETRKKKASTGRFNE